MTFFIGIGLLTASISLFYIVLQLFLTDDNSLKSIEKREMNMIKSFSLFIASLLFIFVLLFIDIVNGWI